MGEERSSVHGHDVDVQADEWQWVPMTQRRGEQQHSTHGNDGDGREVLRDVCDDLEVGLRVIEEEGSGGIGEVGSDVMRKKKAVDVSAEEGRREGEMNHKEETSDCDGGHEGLECSLLHGDWWRGEGIG